MSATHHLDIRPLIARGEEPRDKVFSLVAKLAPGDSLQIVSPFLPAPLIERLRGDGVTARPERQPDGSWCTTFTHAGPPKQ
jgi:uncharacterized protein (DUF2249 family)